MNELASMLKQSVCCRLKAKDKEIEIINKAFRMALEDAKQIGCLVDDDTEESYNYYISEAKKTRRSKTDKSEKRR